MCATVVLSFTSHLVLNDLKWNNPFVTIPFQYHVQYANDPVRLARTGGRLFSFSNISLTLWGYCWPANIRFTGGFPWVYAAPSDPTIPHRFPNAKIDRIEPWTSLPASEPELFFAAVAGIALCLLAGRMRQPVYLAYRAPLLGMMAGGSITLLLGFLSERYLQDAFPWLVIASVIGVASIPRIAGAKLRRTGS